MYTKEKFLEEYQKVPVEEFPNETAESRPLVSVCVTTYQHENYIEKCLDGILNQKTSFNFEILLGEDQSADGTRAICIEYAKKYPKKIRLFLHSRENNIKVFGKPSSQFNFKHMVYESRGKYLAICEGDDFWLDQHKLQNQVEYLENNPDFGVVFSEVQMIDQNNKPIELTAFHEKIRSLYKSGDIFWNLLEQNFINTLTSCFHTELILDYYYRFPEEIYSYDYRIWLHMATYKKIKYFDNITAAYRVHDNGMSRDASNFVKRTPLTMQSGLINYLEVHQKGLNPYENKIMLTTFLRLLRNKNLSWSEKGPSINYLLKKPGKLIALLGFAIRKLF